MTNVTLSGNSAYDTAGGMMHTSTAASVLNNCTIISNTLSSGSPFGGGGLQLYGPTYMTNTLLADNDLANCGILGSNGSLNSGGDNLEDGDSCNLVATGDMTSTDPQITSLAAFGPLVGAPGSQERMSLHAVGRSSPAIDAITKATCPSVDQRGVSRPVDGDGDTTAACDIGAFEFDLLNAVFLPLAVRND
jgi:parallel beta-helix repeat protein